MVFTLTLFSLLFFSCASVKYVDLNTENPENSGYVHFYVFENFSQYNIPILNVTDGIGIVGAVGSLNSVTPSLQVKMIPGSYDFRIAGISFNVEVKKDSITPVSIRYAYSRSNLGNYAEGITLVEPPVPYSAKWNPVREECLAKWQNIETPGIYIRYNTFLFLENKMDKKTYYWKLDQLIDNLKTTHKWSDSSIKILIAAHIKRFMEEAKQATPVSLTYGGASIYFANKLTNATISLQKYSDLRFP